ncbi:MAG: glycosyltransferase involved in cell wall biosynthesis [Francisellaceae bacterium]
MEAWHIFVFSYNRGVFLQNCLDSIKKCCLSIDVTVIDDNSDDHKTIEILNDVEFKYEFELIKASNEDIQEKRLGGLYGNMNTALEVAKIKSKKYVIFIQDDMQFVRQLYQSDFDIVEKIFGDFDDIQQVQSCFLKNLQVDHYKEHLTHIKTNNCFISDNDVDDLSAFSDVGIFCVPRFEQNNGVFIAGERENNKKALQCNVRLAHFERPFMMWLPYGTSYQSKKLNLKNKIIETIAQCGFYRIDIMDDATYKNMINNKQKKLPIAEHWLKADGLSNYPTWCFSAGTINLYARGGLRRIIAKLLWKI